MPDPHLRAGDADREAVAAALGTHMAAGRLTLAEYDERLSRAYAARTFGELAELTADLPAPVPARTTPIPDANPAASRPMPAGCTHRGAPVPPSVATWASHGGRHGSPEAAWRAWLATSVTVLVVYLGISLVSWELHYFWPMWVIGPWGAALLAQRVGGIGRPGGGDRVQLGR